METAWRRSLGSMAVVGLGILGVGILGMAAIFHNQRRHLENVRALEEEIHRNERLSELGNLAATVAHEIRNPLNSISMGMQRLKAEFAPVQDASEYSHFLTLMQNEVERLNRTVEQFLSLARPLQLSPEPIAVEEFIREVRALLEAQAQASNVQIDVKSAPSLPPLWADRNYLKQLLLNLILNGIQAMPAGGRLSLEAAQENSFLRLTVSDHGTGIQPDQAGKIFDPYFTTKPSGSGLGLAIARRIAEAHGGNIDVQSKPGQGASFHVALPLGNNS
jgi:two-component system sensor histidine kinase HydH